MKHLFSAIAVRPFPLVRSTKGNISPAAVRRPGDILEWRDEE